jgi:thiamine kinase
MDKPLQPDTALNSWREWHIKLYKKPVILGPMSGGRSNRSFLLDSDGTKMVLRLNGTDTVLPGANRRNEAIIWKAASEAGIAPPLLYADEKSGFLVDAYIDNKVPSLPPLSELYVDQAIELLRRCHQLDFNGPVVNYGGHIEHYWQLIESKTKPANPVLKQQRKPIQELLEQLINSDPETGLCHHDPVIANFVGTTEKLYLIDWEYAAIGLQIMDYAALATEWEIDDATMHRQTGLEPEELTMAKSLYCYICALWKEIT